MQAEYHLTFKDYKNANKLWQKNKRFGVARYVLAHYVFAAFVVLGWLYIWRNSFHGTSGKVIELLILLVAVFGLLPWLRELTLRRRFRTFFPAGTSTAATFAFDSGGFVKAVPGSSEARVQWAALVGYAEDEKGAILLLTKISFFILPKRALSQDEWADLRAKAQGELQQRADSRLRPS